jgi:hypothetical protein
VAYWGSFYDETTQVAGSVNTPYAIKYGSIGGANGVTVVGNTRITFNSDGVYNIQFSAQLHNAGGGGNGTTVRIWLRKNGVDVADSAGTTAVNTNNPYIVVAWNYVFEIVAGDYYELMWSTDNTNIVLLHNTTGSPAPHIPSIILTATQVTYTQVGPQGGIGPTGSTGAVGETGPTGQPGVGLPTGGSAGQVLIKVSEDDYDFIWADTIDGGTP